MDIFAQFATDPNLELNGVFIPLGGALEDGPHKGKVPQIKVARSGNKRHGRIVSKLYDTNKHTLDLKNDAAEAKGEEITVESMAEGILMGWTGLSFNREALPDSDTLDPAERTKIAKKLLSVKDFRAMVMRHADNFEKFRVQQEEADAKP